MTETNRVLLRLLFIFTALALAAAASDAFASQPSFETLTPSSLGRAPLDFLGRPATAIDLVQREWQNASSFSEKSIQGWYEGRCYFRDRPNQPVAALLVVSNQVSGAHGNLKGLQDRKSILQIVARDVPPDQFGHLGAKTKSKIENLAAAERNLSTFAYQASGADAGLIVDFLRTDERESFQTILRRTAKHMFAQTTCTEHAYCLNSNPNHGANRVVAVEGDATTYCYYFRRLKR
ncbi:hypothetical protein BH10BDE1_BH10BDE1_12680 [soil metagenome]